MTTYGFRLRFLLPDGKRINYNAESLDFKLPTHGTSITIRAISAKSIEDAGNIAIIGAGFLSAEKALQCGQRVKNALLMVGTNLQIGIDPGKDQAKGGIGQVFKDMHRERGINSKDDIHGLCIYEEDKPVSFCSVRGDPIIGTGVDRFVQELINTYIENPTFSEKQKLALELYNSSHFESSLRARFVTLVTAVEALSMRSKIPKNAGKYLDILIDITLMSSLKDQIQEIKEGLANLKQESISKACSSLVKKRLGEEEEIQFKKAYKIRSEILHEGLVPRGIDLGSLVPTWDELVSKLIIQDIKASSVEVQ